MKKKNKKLMKHILITLGAILLLGLLIFVSMNVGEQTAISKVSLLENDGGITITATESDCMTSCAETGLSELNCGKLCRGR